MTASRKRAKNPALNPIIFDATWWGCVDELWIELGRHSNKMATNLHHLVAEIPGVELGTPPEVNSLFPRLPHGWIELLRDWCFFWDWDVTVQQVRWMTAWDTTERDVKRFASGVRAISGSADSDR